LISKVCGTKRSPNRSFKTLPTRSATSYLYSSWFPVVTTSYGTVDAGDRVDGNGLVDAEPRPPLPLPDGATSALDLFSHDITDDKAVAEPFVQDPPDAFRHLVLVQFMVPRRTLGVDLLLVDAGDRVDGNGLVDAEPRPPLPLPEKVCSVALAEGGQGGAGVGTTRIGRDSRGWD
jgi:2',3'-cyclic-nucleotide 2'-phosphodiesterase (5'-nucleotidase family)